MRISIEPTDVVVPLKGGGEGRLWQGTTDSGVRIVAVVTLIAMREEEDDGVPLAQQLAKVIQFPKRPR